MWKKKRTRVLFPAYKMPSKYTRRGSMYRLTRTKSRRHRVGAKSNRYRRIPGQGKGYKTTASLEKLFGSVPKSLTLTSDRISEAMTNAIRPYTRTRQNYYEQVNMGDGANAVVSYYFKINSTFDPNGTGTGHQPYARDELATLYQRYAVLGCNVSVVFENLSNEHYLVALRVGAFTDTLSQSIIMEQSSRWLKKTIVRAANENIKDEWKRLRIYVPVKKFLPGGFDSNGKDTFISKNGATVGADPAVIVPVYVHVTNVDGSTVVAADAIRIRVLLTQDIVYYTPVSTALSS